MYPGSLDQIVDLFEGLPDPEKREMLIGYAENSAGYTPAEGETFDLEDVRKDEECTDTVGIFLHVDKAGNCHFKVTLGPKVQTLTRAMTTILCKGLDGCSPREVAEVSKDFIPRIVGAELVRLRSQTIYYVLTRIKDIADTYLRSADATGL